MVSYHSQLITSHNGISDVFKPPESCRSGRGQTDSLFPHSPVPSLLFSLHHISQTPTPAPFKKNIFPYSSKLPLERVPEHRELPNKQRDGCKCEDVFWCGSSDWLTGWEPFCLIKTPPWSFHCAVLSDEWYCIVGALPFLRCWMGLTTGLDSVTRFWLKVSPSHRFGLHGSLHWPV